MNERNIALEMLLFELRTTGVITYDQWLELLQHLTPPTPREDPAPGHELVKAEEPPSSEERDPYERMAEIFERTASREKELQKNPPPPDERIKKAAEAAAKIQQRLCELADVGCHLEVDLEPDEPWDFDE